MFFSIGLIFNIGLRVVFNLFAEIKMPIDKWMVIDFISCILNMITFTVTGKMTVETILDPN